MNMGMITPRTIWHCISKALINTVNHDGIEHAGYLAFLGLLALFPFLVLVTALAGFFGEGDEGAVLIAALFQHLPQHIAAGLEPRIVEITSGPPEGLLTISILGAIWTASSAVEGYRTVLNRAYHVGNPPAYLWRRLMSILQLLVFSFIVTIGMVLMVAVPVLWHRVEEWIDLPTYLAPYLDNITLFSDYGYPLSALVLFAMVANLYYILPNIKQNLRSVLPGAMLTVLGWVGAVKLLTYYLTSFHQVNIIYGSLGGIIATLLFFYIINIVLIYGAEFNYLLQKALGARIEQREASLPPPVRDDDD